jgi:hypothetical protein
MSMSFTQGGAEDANPPFFKPVNIMVEDGRHYGTIYVCGSGDQTIRAQQLAIWLSDLKATDQVFLTIASLQLDVYLPNLIGLMTALMSTEAQIHFYLDQIVADNLAYFYLLPVKVIKGSEGALFIPSYTKQRQEDASGSQRAVIDFYKWTVDNAVTTGRLTTEEADKLHRGSPVVIPDNRFTT